MHKELNAENTVFIVKYTKMGGALGAMSRKLKNHKAACRNIKNTILKILMAHARQAACIL